MNTVGTFFQMRKKFRSLRPTHSFGGFPYKTIFTFILPILVGSKLTCWRSAWWHCKIVEEWRGKRSQEHRHTVPFRVRLPPTDCPAQRNDEGSGASREPSLSRFTRCKGVYNHLERFMNVLQNNKLEFGATKKNGETTRYMQQDNLESLQCGPKIHNFF